MLRAFYIADVPLSTTQPVSRIRLHLDSVKVPGWNEIDAVALVEPNGKQHWAADASASSTYASNHLNSPNIGSMSFAQFERGLPEWSRGAPRQWQIANQAAMNDALEAHGWPMVAGWGRVSPAMPNQAALRRLAASRVRHSGARVGWAKALGTLLTRTALACAPCPRVNA